MNIIYKLTKSVFIAACITLILSSMNFAQVANYTFTQTADTYTPITGGTVLFSGSFDENISAAIPIPTFNFDGVDRTSLYVSANGFITFGAAPAGTNYTPISNTATYNGAVSPFGRDLNNGASGTPEVRYEQVGNEFVVQWQDVRRYNITGELISFQVRLNSSNNSIKIVYGGTITPGVNTSYPQVGLRGPNNTFATNVKNRTIAVSGGNWINSTAGTTNASTMYFNSTDLTTVPSAGLTYTFTPPNFPPAITYGSLLNTSSTSNRNLSGVLITDPNGVNGTSGTAPRIYYKKSSDANVFGGNTSGDNGWKWTESTGTSPFNFTIDYSIINGGSVALADTIQYFVVAQDLAGTPAVGSNPSAGFAGTSVSTITSAPTTPNKYIISAVALTGDYTVGTATFNKFIGKNIYFEKVVHKVMKEVDVLVAAPEIQNEKSGVTNNNSTISAPSKQLMEVEETTWIPMVNGIPYKGDLFIKKADHPEFNFPDGIEGIYSTLTAAVADLNLRGVSGPTRFLLTDANYSVGETFPITFDIANENLPTATNTVTIKPNTGVTSVITGTTAINVFGIYDDYIIFDGSNTVGGTTRDLTIVNTYLASTFNVAVVLWSSTKVATNITVKNCIIESDPTETSSYGLFLNYAGGGYDNTSFINNKIQNAKVGIQFVGFPAPGLITNNGLISGNIIGDATKPVTLGGISGSYVDNLTITGNEIFGQAAGNTNTSQYGVTLGASSTNCKIRKNNIHDFYYTGTSGYGCFGIRYNGDATTVTEISNNFIHNIKSDGDASSLTFTPAGIYIISGGNVQLYYNSVNMSGNTLGRGTSYDGRSSGISVAAGVTLLDIRNNILQNSMGSFPGSTRTNLTYGVYSASDSLAYTNINYNDYFVNGVNPYVGFLGVNRSDLTAWQTATGKDLNSISVAAAFTDSTNLHIPNGTITALESAGTPIVGITTDIDGQTRNATTPDIGADEFAGINPSIALAGTYYIGVAGSGPGGTDPEFASLKAACDTLNISNVSANTTFFITSNLVEPTNVSIGIDPGDFTVTFKPYTGTVDTITFTQVADNVGVSGGWVLGTPSLAISSATNYGLVTTENIVIDGSNTVGGTTRDLIIRTITGVNGNTNPIRVIGDVNNSVLKNLVVRTGQSVSYGISITNRFFAATGNWTPDNFTVTNCDVANTLSTTAQGVAISNSGTPTAFPTGIEFSYNDIVARTRGIFINYGGDANIFNNNITVNQTTTGYFSDGILTLSIGDTSNVINIYNNKFVLISTANATTGTYGIAAIEPGSRGIYNIYNNMITGFTTTTSTTNPNCILNGIRVTSALPKVNLYFNTIYMNNLSITPGTGTVMYAGIYMTNGTVVAKNNIVQSDESDFPNYAIYRSGTNGTLQSDYNNFYCSDTTNGFVGFWNAAATKTLANWQTASGLDANSLNVVAPFASASDLHIPDGTITSLESAGTPIALVTTDIDGQPRNLSNPDIGADEFAGLLLINAPSNLSAVADTFAVLLSWTDNSTNELGFYIERKNGDTLSVDPYVVIDTVGADAVSYNDLGRTPNTTYTYRVQAFNLLGVSPYSNEVTATTIIPVELTSFAASLVDKEISVVWSTATELNNSGFELERKLDADWQKVVFIEGRGTTTEKSDYSYTDKFKYDGFEGTVQYRLKQIDFDGTITYSNVISVDVDFTPKEYTLYQNYPNPFNPSTTIKFALPFDSNVRIAVYNLLGEQVEVIFDQVKEVGYHNVSWNASDLASGVYIYTIDAKSIDGSKNFTSVKKMMLLK